MEINNQRGQTVVEYILLLAVAISLVLTFYNSEAFKRLFGNEGSISKRIKLENEFGYRHAYTKGTPGDVQRDIYNAGDMSIHPSYHDPNRGGTRFFGPRLNYP